MDPNAALKELRTLAVQKYPDTEDTERMQELVVSLDEWLCKGGFLPAVWDTQVHFDSYGCLYGQEGYKQACKDPQNWEAHWYGERWLLPDAWMKKVQETDVEDTTEFRRRLGTSPITCKELCR